MISLEQVHALEARVERAVSYIAALRGENAELRRRAEEEHSFVDQAAVELEAAETARSSAEARVTELERRVAEAEAKASDLAARIEEYRRDQTKIEEGILHALDKLDTFEDLILGQTAAPEHPTGPAPAKPAPAAKEPAPAAAESAVKEALRIEEGTETAAERATEPERRGIDSELDIF